LGTRPPLTAASSGSIAKVTAGSRNSSPDVNSARAHEPLTNRKPLMSSQSTVRLPNSVRAVTVWPSATVRRRTIIAEAMTGITSSGAVHGTASTTASRPSAPKPDARCAVGDIRTTTGATSSAARSSGSSAVIHASSHWAAI